jgi:hypothetical protein
MGGDQQRVELRLFLLPAMSLTVNLLPCPFKLPKLDLCAYLCAVISNSLNLLNLVSRPVEGKASAQHMALCLDCLPHGSYHIQKHRDSLWYYLE